MERIKVTRFTNLTIDKFFIPLILSIVIIVSIIDTSITRLAVFTGGFTPTLNIIVFLLIVVTYAIGQYLILNFIKRKLEISKIPPFPIIHKIVAIFQYVQILCFGTIIVQIILTSSYNVFLLGLILCTTCILSIALLGYLAKKFLSWFRTNHDASIISYALAMVILSINIALMMTIVINTINTEAGEVRHIRSPVSIAHGVDNIFNSAYVLTSVLSFILLWVSTVLLLRYYSKKLGTARYWIIVSAPLFYFLSQFQTLFINIFDSFRLSDPILFGVIFTLIFSLSKPIGGILFGVSFWMVSRRVGKHAIKDYLIVSAFGVVLLLTTNQATNLILVPYPPFGLVTSSLLGLSSYMLLVGIYSSAMSISRDTELRKFIHTVAAKEISLLDRIGSAQMEQELVTKVIPLVQRKAHIMEQETGIETSLSDVDMMQYLDEVLTEVRNSKKNNENENEKSG